MADPRIGLKRDLAAIAHHLATDELRVLVHLAVRVRAGHAQYGRLQLAGDRRDFAAEALDELTDGTFYLAAALSRRTGRRRRARRGHLRRPRGSARA